MDADAPAGDILDRLKIYDQLGPLSCLAIHPDTPGYSTGRLYGDARKARAEITALRAVETRLTEEVASLRERNAWLDLLVRSLETETAEIAAELAALRIANTEAAPG